MTDLRPQAAPASASTAPHHRVVAVPGPSGGEAQSDLVQRLQAALADHAVISMRTTTHRDDQRAESAARVAAKRLKRAVSIGRYERTIVITTDLDDTMPPPPGDPSASTRIGGGRARAAAGPRPGPAADTPAQVVPNRRSAPSTEAGSPPPLPRRIPGESYRLPSAAARQRR